MLDVFRSKIKNLDTIIIGGITNEIVANKVYVTTEIYEVINRIDKEEGADKRDRFYNRIKPIMKANFDFEINALKVITRDYSVLLQEIIDSGELTKKDIIALTDKLEEGEVNNIVIEKQINKQVSWLIETIELLLEEKKLTTAKAKEFGFKHFKYAKASITGPEHLIEKILTDFGQFTLFGVPILLNTNKYVKAPGGQSRSQFDLILGTHLGDLEVVELKKTDEVILDYDRGRNKFYPSKNLSIAFAQAERYITAVTKDNDEEYIIGGLKIRNFINSKVGATLYIETIRPKALILIGSWETISKPYSSLNAELRSKINEMEYNDNSLRAYRELKESFKNIKILNYSELLEHARTRLELAIKKDN